MSQWKYNDVELEVDMEDVEFQEKYENAFAKMADSEEKLQKTGTMSELTRGYCQMFYDFFDDIFGEGTSKRLMGEKLHSGRCEECYNSFVYLCKEQINEINRKRAASFKKFVPKRK